MSVVVMPVVVGCVLAFLLVASRRSRRSALLMVAAIAVLTGLVVAAWAGHPIAGVAMLLLSVVGLVGIAGGTVVADVARRRH